MLKCVICQEILKGKQKKFCSNKCKCKDTNSIYQNYRFQRIRGQKRKIALVKMLGGKCTKCGYEKNYAALCFHHIDPSNKKHKLDMQSLSNRSWEAVLKEAEKCILLCHNCHMEEHYPILAL